MLIDDNGISCFVDDLGAVAWIDDLGQELTCGMVVRLVYRKI
jgi:hypothetical protein